MTNAFFSQVSPSASATQAMSGKGVMPKAAGPTVTDLPLKTAAWGGLPGKSGPNRSGGTSKLKIYAKSEGI